MLLSLLGFALFKSEDTGDWPTLAGLSSLGGMTSAVWIAMGLCGVAVVEATGDVWFDGDDEKDLSVS